MKMVPAGHSSPQESGVHKGSVPLREIDTCRSKWRAAKQKGRALRLVRAEGRVVPPGTCRCFAVRSNSVRFSLPKILPLRAGLRAASTRPDLNQVGRPARLTRPFDPRKKAVRFVESCLVWALVQRGHRLTKLCTAEGRGVLDYNHAASVPFL